MNSNNVSRLNLSLSGELGRAAFLRGAPCAPALDAQVMSLCGSVGTSAPTLKAWIKGWTRACLAAK